MGGNVSMIDGHIDGADTCVVCGRDIPEGSQYCIMCGYMQTPKKQRQVDRIRNMSVEEMAEFIEKDMLELDGGCIKAYHKCEYVITCGSCVNSPKCIKKWLEQEVSE